MEVLANDIRIEKLNFNDSRDYFKLIRDNKGRLMRYFPLTVKSAESLESITESIKLLIKKADEKEVFCFCVRYNDLLVGLFYIKSINFITQECEFAYFIDTSFEGQGITSFAFLKMIKYCFDELKLKKISLRIDPLNLSSLRLAEKTGFKKIKVMTKEFKIETGEYIDLIYFELLKTNLEKEEGYSLRFGEYYKRSNKLHITMVAVVHQ